MIGACHGQAKRGRPVRKRKPRRQHMDYRRVVGVQKDSFAKLELARPMSDDRVTVFLGDDESSFCLDAKDLCACSPFFASALTGGFREAKDRVVRLPEVDAETFELFEKWLRDRRIPELKERDWKLLCKFFVLTDYLQLSSVLLAQRDKEHRRRKP
ncbi:hypothetical protein QBC46DRAFT_402364 [Diplogelasinospora grovesii]|uniref:BTB domain-containing protein n=1 Tax=Diplogelasinospora grovesii TaxID=303347 RepID=A0AAN6MU19_9PEZI|nr:hypothetical protein QBC46DRAFT_402364 [Diplogelasinospora grovesii]